MSTVPRCPDLRNQEVDPSSCELLPGHQHAAADVEELADSIATLGQLNPIQLLEYPDGRRFIAAGRRRWLACKERGYAVRADIWLCEGEEDAKSENLARAMRVAENTERCDPSAIDVAYQLRRIRNEEGLRSAKELGAFVGMSESRVKRYLCVLQASDFLLDTARAKSLPIKTVAELMRVEKQVGERSAKKFIQAAADGEMTARDLKAIRDKAKAPKTKAAKKKSPSFERKVKASCESLVTMVSENPAKAAPYIEKLVAKLQGLCLTEAPTQPSSPG